ncbi:tetratricopeptide repeat protein [uncultured Bartonella sp.]|uniref:tetratricopeptide repeat protein n=1 Tax=uncultured Bartonella sp. TaxID=104108 RepID=UPI00261887E7|nr:tetratricopeptide repeat protein [uncultured Bartonella sp.]
MHAAKVTRLIALLTAGTMLMTVSAFAKKEEPIKAGSFAGAYLAGRVAASDNQPDLAISYFKQALDFEPNNVSMQQDMLLTLLSAGKFKDAVTLAKRLKESPDVERYVRLTLASDALLRKNYNTAKNELKFSDPSDMDVLSTGLIGAWATFGRGNTTGAIEEVKKLLGPAWYDLFLSYHLALMSDLAGHKDDAQRYYKQALHDQQGGAAAPDTYERIIISFASFNLRNNKREEALATLREGEKMLTGRDTLKNIRQQVENGSSLDMVVKTPQEGSAEVLYDLGTAINRGGAEAFARIFLQLANALHPQNDATLFQLADISSKLEENDRAIDIYQEIPVKSPYYRDAELRLALILADEGKSEEAIRHLSALEKEFPEDQRISMAMTGVYMQDKAYGKAAEVMDRAIARIPHLEKENWLMLYQRGMAEERLKEWDKAEPDFRKALELSPDQPQVLNYLGYSLIDRNEKLDEALNMVKRAAELRAQDGYIVDSLGWAYYKLGRYDEAVKTLENAIKLRPEDPTINDHLGDAYWQVGRKLEATFQWNHAIAGKPEPEELAKIQEKLKSGLKTETAEKSENKSETIKQ